MNFMKELLDGVQWQVIGSIVLVILYLLLRIVLFKTVDRVGKKLHYHGPRRKVTRKIVNIILLVLFIGSAFFIWGVDQSDLLFFVSSLLTVLGVAFFAQWSIMSNITSTLIIFFNHPAKIGDKITILDKENEVGGTISDIGAFFILIKTEDNKKVSIPSNLFLQKIIRHEKTEGSNT